MVSASPGFTTRLAIPHLRELPIPLYTVFKVLQRPHVVVAMNARVMSILALGSQPVSPGHRGAPIHSPSAAGVLRPQLHPRNRSVLGPLAHAALDL